MDPAFQPVLNAVGRLDISSLQRPIYVALVGAILGQKISYAQAKSLRSGLYSAVGTNFQPQDLDDWLKTLQSDKADIIRRLNEYLVNHPLQTADDVRSLKVQGIGPWTIATTLLVAGLDPDVFPSGDLFIQNRLQRLFQLPKRPTTKETELISQRWSPHRSTYAWYLWRWF